MSLYEGLDRPGLVGRFLAKVDKTETCWLWTASRNHAGYGMFVVSVDGSYKSRVAHRVSYMLFVGEVPDGLTLDHICRVRECVRPDHLEPVTGRENTMRSPIAPAAVNAAKSKCHRGHPLVGNRRCRPCGAFARRLERALAAGGELCVECDGIDFDGCARCRGHGYRPPYRTCANCGAGFVWTEGRRDDAHLSSVHCSKRCSRAAAQRAWRKRVTTSS